MNARETYQLLIRIQRVLDAVACTWAGAMKQANNSSLVEQRLIDLMGWSEQNA